jgi:hypothetical protein
MKKPRRLTMSIILVAVAFLLTASATYAWVAIHMTASEVGYYESGEIAYTIEGSFIASDDFFAPSENLLTQTIAVNNESSIETALRIKISYTRIYVDTSEQLITETTVFRDQSSDPIDLANDDHITVNFGSSVHRVGDYYLLNTSLAPDSGYRALILSLFYDGDYAGNQYTSQNIQVTVVVEVRQADGLTWSEMTTIDFETGLPT